MAALRLQNLSRRYGPVVALDNLSFSVEEGQIFGFVGPNGAGKTTAMRIILGVLGSDSGKVLWRGKPADAEARRRFGYMPEERGLYPKMRVGDELAYFARLHGLSAKEARAAAREWMERLGVADRAADRVEALSLGNQQRVQLAAALVHGPELLVLDEPFSGLDPVGVDSLSEVLRERAASGVPVIFSSHQLDLVERLCESVAIINRGSLVAVGPVDELRSSGERRLLRVRFRDGAGRDWGTKLEGVEVVEADEAGLLLSLHGDVDEQCVLDEARSAGKVVHFGFERRPLAEVFREVMEE